jgi:hypothetical protein
VSLQRRAMLGACVQTLRETDRDHPVSCAFRALEDAKSELAAAKLRNPSRRDLRALRKSVERAEKDYITVAYGGRR